MHAILYSARLLISIMLPSVGSTTFAFNQTHATVVAAATHKLTQQTDTDLVPLLNRFKNLLERIQMVYTKKSLSSYTCHICEKQLQEVEKKFNTLHLDYEQRSPAFVILGPIGAAATVLKEKKITQDLLQCIDCLAQVVNHMAQQTKEHKAPIILEPDIYKALKQLERMITELEFSHYRRTRNI